MKRIIYSCIFFLSLFLTSKLQAQAPQATITPDACKYQGSSYIGSAGMSVPNPAASSYSWTIIDPNATPVLTYSVVQGTPAPGQQITFTLTGGPCGTYSLQVFAVDNAGNLILGGALLKTVTLYCPPSITVASTGSICGGFSSSLTASGAVNYTWNPGNYTAANPYVVSPLATTCYTAIGASAQGCTSTPVSTCVAVQNVSVSIAPTSQTFCPGITATLTALTNSPGYTYQWYQTSPTAATLQTASTQSVSPVAPGGTYSVRAVYNTCTTSATASITISNSLSILIVPSSPSVCPSEQFTLTAYSAGTVYAWGYIPLPNPIPNPTVNPPNTNSVVVCNGPGIFTVSAKNGFCPGFATFTIYPTRFTPTIVPSSPAVCPGETFTLTGLGGATPADYIWAFAYPPAQITPTPYAVSVPSITPTQTVSTRWGVIATNTAGCQDTTSVRIDISPDLTVTASASAAQVCAGSQVTLSASGNGASTFTWTSPAGPVGTGSVITIVPNTSMTYSVVGGNANGFCASAPATVAVNMITGGSITPTLAVSASTVCTQQLVNITSSVSVTNATYAWSPTLTINGPNNTPSITVAPDVTTTYTVFVSNSDGGCTGTRTITVFVTPTPTVTASASSTFICRGYTATLTAFGAASYQWTGSSMSLPVNQQTISVSPGPTSLTPATYTVIGTPAVGNCTSAPVSISIYLAPDLQIGVSRSDGTTCITTNANPFNPYKLSKPIDLTAYNATDYSWIPNTQPYMTYSVGANTTVRPPTTTCYTVTGSTSVCSGTNQICVTVIPQFTMNVVPLSPVMCIGDSMNLSIANVGALAMGPEDQFTYNWLEAANAPPPSLNFYGTPSVTAYPQNTTTYTVEMKDSRMCVSLPRLTTVTVLPMPLTAISIPTINNVPTNTICFVGDIPGAPDVYLDLKANNQNTGLPFGVVPTYTWDSPYFPESFVTSKFGSVVKIVAPKRMPSVVVYTVATGYNGVRGCSVIDTVTVRVIDCRPVIQANILFGTDVEHDTLCARECITYFALTDTMAGGPQTYTWVFKGGDPPVSYDPTPVVCYNLPGRHDVVLAVGNPYPKYNIPAGSSATVAFRNYITVQDIPNVTIIAPGQRQSDTTIRYGQSIALTGTNALSYVWSPPYNITSTTDPDVIVNPYKTTQYVLTGFNTNRCYSSDTLNVIVIQDCGDMFVPNAFSPNGDGVNDELKIYGRCLQTLTFMIFDRWGEKVFETSDINDGWDGTYHGEKMNTGVFVYRLEGKALDGKGYSFKGNITLVR